MTSPALIERITRSLAYMLRHQPEEFDLELDAQGYGDVGRIVQALNERLGEPVSLADLEEAIHAGDRPRYEIVGSRARALYGHSIDVEPGEPTRPPEMLFVGISARDADRAMRYGLRGGRRRFLHLALTPDDAKEGGRRAAREYVVITVYALDAWEEGINFYDRRALFLAEQIPTEFLEVGELCHDGTEPDVRPAQGRREPQGNRGDRHRGGGDRQPQRGFVEPRRAPAPSESFEEEGFGEGTPDAIHVDRERGAAPQQAFERNPVESSGGAPGGSERGRRGGRGGRGGRDRNPAPEGGNRRPAQEPQRAHGWADVSPADSAPQDRENRMREPDRGPARPFAEQGRGRSGPERSFEREPSAPREAEGDRQGRFAERGERPMDRPERAPRQQEFAERGPERGERPMGRPERAPRQPEFAERAPDRGGERPMERGERAPRQQEFSERGERQPDRGPDRGGRAPERGDRPERGFNRPDREAPRSAPAQDRGGRAPDRQDRAPEQQPVREAPRRDDGGGFGLGIFEEPKRDAPRPAAAPQRAAPPTPPPAPPPAPPRSSDPFEGFGAGV